MPPKLSLPEQSLRGDERYGSTSLRKALYNQVSVKLGESDWISASALIDGKNGLRDADLDSVNTNDLRPTFSIIQTGNGSCYFRPSNAYFTSIIKSAIWAEAQKRASEVGFDPRATGLTQTVGETARRLYLDVGTQPWYPSIASLRRENPDRATSETLPLHALQTWQDPAHEQIFERYLAGSRDPKVSFRITSCPFDPVAPSSWSVTHFSNQQPDKPQGASFDATGGRYRNDYGEMQMLNTTEHSQQLPVHMPSAKQFVGLVSKVHQGLDDRTVEHLKSSFRSLREAMNVWEWSPSDPMKAEMMENYATGGHDLWVESTVDPSESQMKLRPGQMFRFVE